jgi:LmbE family N-acetylglucosaminyl deacetylase
MGEPPRCVSPVRFRLGCRVGALAGAAVMALPLAASPMLAPEPVSLEGAAMSPGEIVQGLRKLGVTARVLHVAAHPDDENTRLLAWLANELLVETAYLSLTRGGGGQNLIGPELREELGVIRTQELLAARRIDRARQFFTRAVDFGYSKTQAETLRIWDHEAALADVVWVVRAFRPDVIVTRFEARGDYTHGHHTASTTLALEAFAAAGDPTRFPEQLEWVAPWQPKRVVWNTFRGFFERGGRTFDPSALGQAEVGGYLPLRGESVGEIAARSRSQHKSQGFGAGATRGSAVEYFELLAGEPMTEGTPFDGVAMGWERHAGGDPVATLVGELVEAFDPARPEATVPGLLRLRGALVALIGEAPELVWKRAEVDRLVAACLGLHGELLVPDENLVPGVPVEGRVNFIQQLPGLAVRLEALRPPFATAAEAWSGAVLAPGVVLSDSIRFAPPAGEAYAHPYWLREPGTPGCFEVADARLIGLAEAPAAVAATVELSIGGERFSFLLPALSRRVDPVDGEVRTAARVVRPGFVNFSNGAEVFPAGHTRPVTVRVGGHGAAWEGSLRLEAPAGWRVEPPAQAVSWVPGAGERTLAFTVTPGPAAVAGTLEAVLTVGSERLDRGFKRLDYPHIPPQVLTPPAAVSAVPVDLVHPDLAIGYLPGAGDAVADSLRAVGLKVRELDPATLDAAGLAGLDSVLVGIRAFNVLDQADRLLPLLFAFAEAGGTVVVQYQVSRGLKTDGLAPFPLSLGRGRVTDEAAEMVFLAPDHTAMHWPNRLGPVDFEGWVQERGLYYAEQWDPAFTPLLAARDPGEEPLAGGLLVARHGEGWYVYSGISFFRQLPAGVPGAYRLLVNLLSLGHD